MAGMHWINAEKSLDFFLEQDLPFLIRPHCNDTLKIIIEMLQYDIQLLGISPFEADKEVLKTPAIQKRLLKNIFDNLDESYIKNY